MTRITTSDFFPTPPQRYSPVLQATGMTFTGTNSTYPTYNSYFAKYGYLISFWIEVNLSTVTNFGTGQYSLTIPFPSKYHTDVYGGSIHDVVSQGIDHFSLKGHLNSSSNNMSVWSIGSSAKDELFDHNSPFVLSTQDMFHMAFSYIRE